jgi:hypothetical protein
MKQDVGVLDVVHTLPDLARAIEFSTELVVFSKRRSEIGHRKLFIGRNVVELNHLSSQIGSRSAVSGLKDQPSNFS